MCEMYWLILPLLLQREKKKFLNVYLVPFFKNVLVISFKFNIAETLSFLHQLFGSCYFQSYGQKFFSVDILSLAGRLISFLVISIACYRKKRKMAGVDIFVGLFFMPKLPSVFFRELFEELPCDQDDCFGWKEMFDFLCFVWFDLAA